MIQWLLDLLFPPRCVLCHKFLENSKEPVCDRCGMFVLKTPATIRKGRYFARCVAALPYEGDVQSSVQRYKFAGLRFYAKAYGKWIAAALAAENVTWDVITWVPVSRKRRARRGFDQAELLCREIAACTDSVPVTVLKKYRNNPAQSSIRDAEKRRANVTGVYRVCNAEAILDKRVLLVDDVITTGATLEECSRMLLAAGCKQVQSAALAAR